jgi:hypothetical protein
MRNNSNNRFALPTVKPSRGRGAQQLKSRSCAGIAGKIRMVRRQRNLGRATFSSTFGQAVETRPEGGSTRHPASRGATNEINQRGAGMGDPPAAIGAHSQRIRQLAEYHGTDTFVNYFLARNLVGRAIGVLTAG